MKKIISLVLLCSFLTGNIAFCETNTDITSEKTPLQNEEVQKTEDTVTNRILTANTTNELSATVKKLSKKEYKRSTIYKYYTPYEVVFKNSNELPILLTTDTEINFVKSDDSVIKSATRRDIYMRTRKRDRGRHYALAIPGIFLGTAVTFGTFMLGAPLGYGIYKAFQYPVIKAGRTNVNISQDLYSHHSLPLRFEKGVEYSLYFYPPEKTEIKTILIKNVLFNDALCDIELPVKEDI